MSLSVIHIHKGEWTTILAHQNGFNGQKIHHPFKTTRQQEKVYFKTGKRTKSRIIDQMIYTPEFVSEEIEKFMLDDNTVFQIKHDGSCGKIVYNPETDSYAVYTRIDVKIDEVTGEWKEPNPEWLQCEEKPTIINKNMHWPHFRSCEEDYSSYKYRLQAFDALDKTKLPKQSFTCEFMGTKLGSPKNVDIIKADCKIVPHGSATITVPKEFRSLDGFGEIFELYPFMEGLIISNPNYDMKLKIRRDLIVRPDNDRLQWPPRFIDHSLDLMHVSELCAL